MAGRRPDGPFRGHGNIFTPHAGSMLIHVHRESGLAHRTMRLEAWQVQALRLITSKWFALVFAVGVLSWGWFALQAARVPFLQQRITHMEEDAARLDTLQATLTRLQSRYDEVQRMFKAASVGTGVVRQGPPKRSDVGSSKKPRVVIRSARTRLARRNPMAMFNKDGPPRSEVRSAPGSEAALSIIAASVRLVGDLESPGVVKVDGQIEGSVTGARQLLLGRGGVIHGNIAADEIVIGGLVDGSIVAGEKLELQSTAVVNGDIETRSITVLEGAKINGSVRMTDLAGHRSQKTTSTAEDGHNQIKLAT